MAYLPDLITILKLSHQTSRPAYGTNIRTVVIAKDFTNSGDFVFSSFIHFFSKRENLSTSTLLISTSHSWNHYSSCAAKCGVNIRSSDGNIKVVNILDEVLKSDKKNSKSWMEFIYHNVSSFITDSGHDKDSNPRPVNIMIDDLTHFQSLGMSETDIFMLFQGIHETLDNHQSGCNYFITQMLYLDSSPDSFVLNLSNFADIFLSVQPLKTGFSNLVDGTLTILDNRLPAKRQDFDTPEQISSAIPDILSSRLTRGEKSQVGLNKTLYFKLAERRVKLTPNSMDIC